MLTRLRSALIRRAGKLRLLALVAATVAAVWYQAPVSADTPAQIGMTVHVHHSDAASLKRQFDLMAAMKVTWVRMDVDWSAVESERGQYDWSNPDKIAAEATAHRMNVLAVLAYTPIWAAKPSGSHRSTSSHARPAHLSDYARFAQLAAERYAPLGVHAWEIWNEPNIARFWPPRPDPEEYGALFRVAADAIRGVDPKATLLIGGLAQKPDAPSIGTTPTTYLEYLYRNGSAQLADGVAAHPYSFPSLPMDASGQAPGGFTDLPRLHAVMDKNGDGEKKIWLTEFGAPTGSAANAVSEKVQAEMLIQARDQVERWPWAGPLMYYELVDHGTNPADKEENFGLLRPDLSLKAAATALMGTAPG